MSDTGAWVQRRVIGITVGRTVLPRRRHNAHFDRRICSFHLCDVRRRPDRVRVSVVRERIAVGLPSSVNLVADFPVLEAEMICHVRRGHPCRCFRGRARPVVDGDKGLRTDVRSHVNEIGESRRPMPRVVETGIRSPMIFVRKRPSWESKNPHTHCAQK